MIPFPWDSYKNHVEKRNPIPYTSLVQAFFGQYD